MKNLFYFIAILIGIGLAPSKTKAQQVWRADMRKLLLSNGDSLTYDEINKYNKKISISSTDSLIGVDGANRIRTVIPVTKLPVSDATQTALNGKQNTLTAGTNISIVGNTITANPGTYTYQTATFLNSTTATQISSTKEAYVQYSYDATVTISLLAGQSVTAILEYADNSGMSTNLVTLDAAVTSNSGVLNLTQTNTLKVSGFVPPAKYRRVRFVTAGTGVSAPTSIKSSQERF